MGPWVVSPKTLEEKKASGCGLNDWGLGVGVAMAVAPRSLSH